MKTSDILKNKWLWLTVVAFIVFVVLHKNGKRWWEQLMSRDRGNYDGHGTLNDADRARLEMLANGLHEGIYNTVGSDREEAIAQALGCNDTELRWLADFYKSISDGETLKADLQGEWTLPDVGERLVARLNQLNL